MHNDFNSEGFHNRDLRSHTSFDLVLSQYLRAMCDDFYEGKPEEPLKVLLRLLWIEISLKSQNQLHTKPGQQQM